MLVKVQFKSGKIRELSSHIAHDEQHQKSMGFKIVGEESEIVTPPIKKNKPENPVAETNDFAEVAPVIETESLVSEVVEKIKKRGRPAKK